jgi:hypothetical protein
VVEAVVEELPEAEDSPVVPWATPSARSKRYSSEALLWMGINIGGVGGKVRIA